MFKYSMNILCTSNHIFFCLRAVLYVMFIYKYLHLYTRKIALEFSICHFQATCFGKIVTDCLPDRIAVAFYSVRVVVVEVRENIRPPGQGQRRRRQSFCDILCI